MTEKKATQTASKLANPAAKKAAKQAQLKRNQSDCTPKPQPSSRRDHREAATQQRTPQGTPTLVSL
jgi:hypothetical protein